MNFRQKTSPWLITRVTSNVVLPNLMKSFSQKFQKFFAQCPTNDFNLFSKLNLFCQFSQSDITDAVLTTLTSKLSTFRIFFTPKLKTIKKNFPRRNYLSWSWSSGFFQRSFNQKITVFMLDVRGNFTVFPRKSTTLGVREKNVNTFH